MSRARDSDWANRPIHRWGRIVVAFALLSFGLLSLGSKLVSIRSSEVTRSEFTEDYVAAKAVLDGSSGYTDTERLLGRYLPAVSYEHAPVVLRDPHTPTQIVFAIPLSLLPFRVARAVWMLLMTACFVSAMFLTGRSLRWTRGWSFLAAVGLVGVPIVQRELLYGNITYLVLLLTVLAWRALHRKRHLQTGFALGLAAAIKVFPAFLALVLIRERKWRTLAWFSATLVMSLGLSSTIPGLGVSAFWLSTKANLLFWRSAPMNISLLSVPWRWLSRSYWRPGAASIEGLATALTIILLLACVAGALLTKTRVSRDRFLAAYPWMILASTLAWDRYVVLIAPLMLFAVVGEWRRINRPPIAMLVAAAILAIGQLPGLPGPAPPIGVLPLIFGYGLTTWALLWLALHDAALLSSRRLQREGATAFTERHAQATHQTVTSA